MSVINNMLQDLDARSSATATGVGPVPAALAAAAPAARVALTLVVLGVLAVAAWRGWQPVSRVPLAAATVAPARTAVPPGAGHGIGPVPASVVTAPAPAFACVMHAPAAPGAAPGAAGA